MRRRYAPAVDDAHRLGHCIYCRERRADDHVHFVNQVAGQRSKLTGEDQAFGDGRGLLVLRAARASAVKRSTRLA